MNKKKIVFLSGTRAEFGKLKPLIKSLDLNPKYEVHLFVTGMHMLEKYGGTAREILNEFSNVYLYNNQAFAPQMDTVLSNTTYGFGHYIRDEVKPDLIIVHGDRVEALAGAIVGAFNNILVAHIEGGEISGTIDELIRHSVSKLSHIHFVANAQNKQRLIQMGEKDENIFVLGSPDIDIMFSKNLPNLEYVLNHYDISFKEYAIIIYHPVTTESHEISKNVKEFVDAVIESKLNYVVIYPNNDSGSNIIFEEYKRLDGLPEFKLFPSIRFENFLVLLKNCKFIVGNSSTGIREAPIYAIPSINIGTRQQNRFYHSSILNVNENKEMILQSVIEAINSTHNHTKNYFFGNGQSANNFLNVLEKKDFWNTKIQKQFIDIKSDSSLMTKSNNSNKLIFTEL